MSSPPPRRGAVAAGPSESGHRTRRRPLWLLLLLLALLAAAVILLMTQCSSSGPPAPAAAPGSPAATGPGSPGTAPPPGSPGAPPVGQPSSGSVPGAAAGSAPGSPAPPTVPPPGASGSDGPTLQTRIDQATEAGPISFDGESTEPTPQGAASIDRVAQTLRDTPGPVLITGHTAPVDGDPAHCQYLSEQRAQAVAARLGAAGVDPARLQTRGVSHSQPAASWAASRRVELTAA